MWNIKDYPFYVSFSQLTAFFLLKSSKFHLLSADMACQGLFLAITNWNSKLQQVKPVAPTTATKAICHVRVTDCTLTLLCTMEQQLNVLDAQLNNLLVYPRPLVRGFCLVI